MFAPEQFLDLSCTEHRVIFDNVEEVWQALPKIEAYLQFRFKPGINGKLARAGPLSEMQSSSEREPWSSTAP